MRQERRYEKICKKKNEELQGRKKEKHKEKKEGGNERMVKKR